MFRKLPLYRKVNTGAEDNATNTHLQNQRRHTEPVVRDWNPLPCLSCQDLITLGPFQGWATQGGGEGSLCVGSGWQNLLIARGI